MALDCTDPDVLRSAYGSGVCRSIELGSVSSEEEFLGRQAEMRAAGWNGGGWNTYQAALARRAAKGTTAPAPYPWVLVGGAALVVAGGIYWWRS